MKKSIKIISPFIMLLIPILLVIILLIFHVDTEISAEKYNASVVFQVPSFKVLVQLVFKICC